MIFSDAYPARIKGKPAQIRVCRNNGYCWGRVIFEDDSEFDVDTRRDWYEQCDDDAAEAFERAANRGNLRPALHSVRFGWAPPHEEVP